MRGDPMLLLRSLIASWRLCVCLNLGRDGKRREVLARVPSKRVPFGHLPGAVSGSCSMHRQDPAEAGVEISENCARIPRGVGAPTAYFFHLQPTVV
jgi:hypothetical protein